jgi:hypothetical protein
VAGTLPELADAGMRLVVRRTFLQVEHEEVLVDMVKKVEKAKVTPANENHGFRVVDIFLPAASDISTESDVKSEAGSESSADTIDVSEGDVNGSEAELVHDSTIWQHGTAPQSLHWIPYYMMGFSDYDCQWYVCQQSFSGGPPGIFVHCCGQLIEAQKCLQEKVVFESHDSDRWADMEASLGSEQTGATLFVRNIPSSASRTWLWELLEFLDLSGKFDLIYVPVNFKTGMSYGYGFVNMTAPDIALSAMPKIAGSSFRGVIVGVSLSKHHQGLHTLIARYRNSPVMHESVPDDFQPLMFKNGQPVVFPRPTRNIQAPPMEKCRKGL